MNKPFDHLFDTIETKETDSGAALFSRDKARPASSITKHDADEVIERVIRGWSGLDRRPAFVVDTFDALPDEIKGHADDQGAENEIKGVFHKGKTYLVLDMLEDSADVERTTFHETYGHYGIRKLFGKDLYARLGEMYVALGGDRGIRLLLKSTALISRFIPAGVGNR